MEESGGNEGFQGDEISLLAEELIQLTVKSSIIEPSEKPTLIYTIWTVKSYNPDSFKAQMKSIWKTRRKFEIQDKPLRRGIFVSIDNQRRYWVFFKYEKLPIFCFGYGRIGHGIPDCSVLTPANKEKIRDNPPFSLALKAELNLLGKESLQLNAFSRKTQSQCSYIGSLGMIQGKDLCGKVNSKNLFTIVQSVEVPAETKFLDKEGVVDMEESGGADMQDGNMEKAKKTSWTRLNKQEW
ncbi:hypothetical protein J1N35_035682 [Gossypium stocksii]|uniref:Zinc knuckle CX2CX4HX4C domain-containing protein n=1 Tax=Gossypium stocksii TaxID=47602 RepID=A0A9D3UUG5_9ROSI|nr:hypothetical protein J1N35_035682 [Gossypium stocksii]